MLKQISLLIILGSWLSSTQAQTFQLSDWLSAIEGSKGALLEAEVTEVIQNEDETIVELELPADVLSETEVIQAIDRTKKVITLIKPTETLYDEDQQPTGIRLYFNKAPGFEFRLRLYNELEGQ